jgi:hypothetical protein
MSRSRSRKEWVELRTLKRAGVLLILPCNAAACVGNYFRAEVYRKSGWNTWREADWLLRDLRQEGKVAFAAVDSSTLETAPADPRGAIVLETEMYRVRNPDGEDWGAPSWRWFRPTRAGRWTALEDLSAALRPGVRRIDALGIRQVLALVNPRGYFLALAAAVEQAGLLDRWVLFRVPAHPRHLCAAVREVAPFVRRIVRGSLLQGGVYVIPGLRDALERETRSYREAVPAHWRQWTEVPSPASVGRSWDALNRADATCEQRGARTMSSAKPWTGHVLGSGTEMGKAR